MERPAAAFRPTAGLQRASPGCPRLSSRAAPPHASAQLTIPAGLRAVHSNSQWVMRKRRTGRRHTKKLSDRNSEGGWFDAHGCGPLGGAAGVRFRGRWHRLPSGKDDRVCVRLRNRTPETARAPVRGVVAPMVAAEIDRCVVWRSKSLCRQESACRVTRTRISMNSPKGIDKTAQGQGRGRASRGPGPPPWVAWAPPQPFPEGDT